MKECNKKEKTSNIRIILEWIQKHIVFCIVCIVIFPFIILTPSCIGFLNKSDAQTIVGYFGALVGGLLTLVGVCWTLNDQQKQFKINLDEQKRLYEATVRPNVCLSVIYNPAGVPYLRAKNFGNSNAKIIYFEIDFEIPQQIDAFPVFPLIKIKNYILSPQQFIVGEMEHKYLKSNNHVTVYYQDDVGNKYSNTINLNPSHSNAFYNKEDFEYIK